MEAVKVSAGTENSSPGKSLKTRIEGITSIEEKADAASTTNSSTEGEPTTYKREVFYDDSMTISDDKPKKGTEAQIKKDSTKRATTEVGGQTN